ncbi:MAG: ATP-dependent Clp protease proteolytic subunit [Oscillospiraceae bacterium]|nr:ATP-dependent Clp protease proteolytic subunit [Oscillospiraceae bacterium]
MENNDSEYMPPEISTEPPGGDGPSDGDGRERSREPARDVGGVTVEGRRGLIHCLTVIGQIEGHTELPSETKSTKYEHVIPQLVAIEESREVRGLLIVLNTVGGDIEAGLALAELVAGMRTPTVSLVLGGGHSIGVPLAVAARRSFIAPSATMTIHPVRMNGLVLGVPQTLTWFEHMQERIVRFVAQNSRVPAERYRAMMLETGVMAMDFGTMLSGEQAVAEGLIDEIGGLSQAVEALYGMIPEDHPNEPAGSPGTPEEGEG